MVSKASDDLPEPLTPVKTTSLSRGISTSMFLRLCSRAPCTAIVVLNLDSFRKGRWALKPDGGARVALIEDFLTPGAQRLTPHDLSLFKSQNTGKRRMSPPNFGRTPCIRAVETAATKAQSRPAPTAFLVS